MPFNSEQYLIDGHENALLTLILAHGAGVGMNSPFMETIAKGVGNFGFRVVRFEFDYMIRRRLEGRQFPPDRPPRLLQSWQRVLDDFRGKPLVIGGKSMGGRMASLVAVNPPKDVFGLLCLGYPFHPPGRPETLRTDHLQGISLPTLICQGERDPFGTREEIFSYGLPENFQFHWLPDGSHSFEPRKKSGYTEEQNLESAVQAIVSFLKTLA